MAFLPPRKKTQRYTLKYNNRDVALLAADDSDALTQVAGFFQGADRQTVLSARLLNAAGQQVQL